MEKTLEQLLAGGNLYEVATAIKTRTDRVQVLFAEATKRADKASTQAELDEILQLDDETEKLTAKHAELKKVEDAKSRNEARMKAFTTPVNPMQFPGGGSDEDKDEARKAYFSKYSSVGSLKYINFGSRRDDEELAYRFFKWYCAVGLKPSTPMQISGTKYCEENGIATKALNEGTNEEGGALVPHEFDAMLIRLIERFGRFRQFTRMIPMTSETKSRPRRTGGITAVWTGEGQDITESNQKYDNISLVAKKLAALTVHSSEVSEDAAINIADEIAFEIGYAFALSEDQAGFIGDGSPTYGGITGVTQRLKNLSGTIANIAGLVVATGNLFSEFVIGDFLKVVALLPEYADGDDTGWYCHRTFYYGTILPLILAALGAEAREIMAGERRPRPIFLGYPVNFTQVMPKADANSQIPIVLGDLAMASMMGDRRRRTLFTDPYTLSHKDQVRVRGTERVDINVFDVGNATSTAADKQPGSVVGLISAAS